MINHEALETGNTPELSDEALKQYTRKRLLQLAGQNRAPSVAKAAATELLERVEPKRDRQEAQLSTKDAARLSEIYDRLFGNELNHDA